MCHFDNFSWGIHLPVETFQLCHVLMNGKRAILHDLQTYVFFRYEKQAFFFLTLCYVHSYSKFVCFFASVTSTQAVWSQKVIIDRILFYKVSPNKNLTKASMLEIKLEPVKAGFLVQINNKCKGENKVWLSQTTLKSISREKVLKKK